MDVLFNSLRELPRNVIPGLHDKSVFSFVRNCQNVFHSGTEYVSTLFCKVKTLCFLINVMHTNDMF